MTAAARTFSTARDVRGVCSIGVTAVAKDTHGFRATLARSAALRYALAPVCIAVALLVQVSISGPVPRVVAVTASHTPNGAVSNQHRCRRLVRRHGAGVAFGGARHVAAASPDRYELPP